MVVTSSRLAADEWVQDDAFEPLTYEKVVGLNNLLSIGWVSRALELAACVCRVNTPAGPGSGFLIAPDLLLTNHHVLPDAETAAATVAEFNYQVAWSGELEPVRRFTCDPAFYRNAEELDYAIVRINGTPGDLFGFVDLARRADPTVNDFVSVIQHPQGGPKKIAFTDNKVSAVFGDLVQYSTDTEPGSSGSPVFNQDWEIVGLHHRGGGLAGPDGKKYFTNEGIQIASIVRDAAAFLGLGDDLYDLAFGDLRAALAGLVNVSDPPTDADALARDLLLKRPRFSFALEGWAKLHGAPSSGWRRRPRSRASRSAARCASGRAATGTSRSRRRRRPSRRRATRSSRSSARSTAPTSCPPTSTPRSSRRCARSPRSSIRSSRRPAGDDDGIAAAARTFIRGVAVGAKAYGEPAAAPPAAPPPPARCLRPRGCVG